MCDDIFLLVAAAVIILSGGVIRLGVLLLRGGAPIL